MRQFAFGLLAVLTANISSSVLLRVHGVAVRAGNASGSASPSWPSRLEELAWGLIARRGHDAIVADEDMTGCSICLTEKPAKDLVAYFADCGAGDVCLPGHKFCAECARNAKETSATGALCPVCRESVANAKQGHTCTVCHNAGGPQEREGRTRTWTGCTRRARRVIPGLGCWGCGKKLLEGASTGAHAGGRPGVYSAREPQQGSGDGRGTQATWTPWLALTGEQISDGRRNALTDEQREAREYLRPGFNSMYTTL